MMMSRVSAPCHPCVLGGADVCGLTSESQPGTELGEPSPMPGRGWARAVFRIASLQPPL